MKNGAHLVLGTLAISLGACGGPEQPPPGGAETNGLEERRVTTEPTATATAEPTAEPIAESRRATATKNILDALGMTSIEDAQKARVAAMGLSEVPEYKLARSWQKSLEVVAGDTIDPSQCARILRVTIDEADIKPAAEKRCGKLDVLDTKVKAAKTPGAQAEIVAKACKIDGVKATDKVSPWAVLTAALIEDELAAQPESTADEKKIPPYLRGVCRE